jgi:ribosomal protein L34E
MAKNNKVIKNEKKAETITPCPQCGRNINGPGHYEGTCFFTKREQEIVASRQKEDPTRVNA